MKKLACEMCGSADLIKHDGVFICQHCGMKYSAEEIKKMMIEGTVDIQGTVKVDNSAFVQKYLENARRAKQKEDWEEAEKYYNMVEQNAPSNIEAIFYSSYGKAKTSLVDGDLYKRKAAFKVLENCISIIDDNFDIEKEEENRKIIEEISNDILKMACSSYVYNQRKNGYGIVTWTDKNETVALFNSLSGEFVDNTLNNIASKIPNEQKEKRLFYYNLMLKHANFVLENGNLADTKPIGNIIMNIHEKIFDIDPSHHIPYDIPDSSSGRCYVATAVYGSYDCPEVWTLRRYRDYTLAQTWYGRAFIKTYYAVSPTLVRWFGHTGWFKNMWKIKLDRMVYNLQAQGIASTPYKDKT